MHVRVLSWNVFLRPPGIQQPGGGDHKDLRLEFIMRKVIQYDVVLLQEMFAIGSSRLHRLLSFANDHGLAYHAGSVYPSLWSRQLVDGGLLILSRYPICQTKSHQFRDSCGSDALAAKGVVYAQLQIESQGTLLDVFTTHTQAGQGQVATSIRWRQIQELAWFVHTTRTDATTPAILGGDFNLDARHNVDFAGDPANPVITKCAESVSYKRMLQLFSMRSHDSVANVLGAAHDVTNANGHGVLAQTWSKEQVNDMGKCIDYFILAVGLANISRGKLASGSSMENEGSYATFAVDGNDQTRFASVDSDPQWLEVDLGVLHNISHVCILWEAAFASKYDIQVSTDRLVWTTVASVTDNRDEGWVKTNLPANVDATFVRMYGHERGTKFGYSIYHFNVYGCQLAPFLEQVVVTSANVSLGDRVVRGLHWPVTSSYDGVCGYPGTVVAFKKPGEPAAGATTDVPNDAITEELGILIWLSAPNAAATQEDDVGDEVQTLEAALWATSRDKRLEWKGKLTARPPQITHALDKHLVARVVQGKLVQNDIRPKPNAISVFVSSTFTDTTSERNLLIADVYPYLKRYAALLGLEFSASEMRWGIRDEASNSHQTSAICMAELARCQTSSLGLNYVLILGNKYGYRPFPNQIPVDEFEALVATMASADAAVTRHWFLVNENVVPPAMELQPSTLAAPGTWWPIFEQMQRAFRNSRHVLPDRSRQDLFNISVTECEITHGLLHADDPTTAAFVYHRVISDIDPDHEKANMYVDMRGHGQVDDDAQTLLATLRATKVKPMQMLGSKDYIVPWGPEILPETHASYLADFCDHFCGIMCDALLQASEQLNVAPDAVYNEAMHHALFCAQRSANFVGRLDILSKVHAYIRSPSESPLVLFGRGGAGKSAVMAKVAIKLTGSGGGVAVAAGSGLAAVVTPRHDPVLVLRFLGTSLDSTDIRKLLASMCLQLQRNYTTETAMVIPQSLDALITRFHNLLGLASETKPLVVLLDSLDQLSRAENAHHLTWLPQTLPPFCKLVVSALEAADEGGHCLAKLRAQTLPDQMLELPVMSAEDGRDILTAWLASRHRALTPDQTSFLVHSFMQCPLPLYLHVAFTLSLPWTSSTPVEASLFPSTIPDLLNHLFDKLCGIHGKLLVHHLAGYLTLAKRGLSRTELEDVLSLDDDVLNDVFQWWVPPIRRIPSLVVTRLLSDLDSYLVTHAADGGGIPVLSWYHREFKVAATAICLKDDAITSALSATLASYFASDYAHVAKPFLDKKGVPGGRAHRKVTPQELAVPGTTPESVTYNHRRVSELPSALIGAKDWPRVELVLSDVTFLQASVALGAISDTLTDIRRAIQAMHADDTPPSVLPQVAAFLSRDMFTLQRHPQSFFQNIVDHPKGSFLRVSADARLTPPPRGYFQVVSTETPTSSIVASFKVGPVTDGASSLAAIAFSPNSLKVAAVSEPNYAQIVYLTVFDVISNTVMWTVVAEPDAMYDSVTWTADGTAVVAGVSSSGELHLFSETIGVRTQVLHAPHKTHDITSVVCVDATIFVTADRTKSELNVWEEGNVRRTLQIDGHGQVDHNDKRRVTQVVLKTSNGEGAHVFGKAFDHPKPLIMDCLDMTGSALEVCGLAFHPNHPSILYVFNSTTQIYAFDVVRERRLAIYAAPGHSFGGAMTMSLDGSLIATLGQTNNVLLWHPGAKPAPLGAPGRVESVALHPNGATVAACHSGAESTRIVDVCNPTHLVTQITSTACTRMVFSHGRDDGGLFVAATTNTSAVCVGQIENDQVTTTFYDTFEYESIDVAVHPSGEYVAALGLDAQYNSRGILRYIRRVDGSVLWEVPDMIRQAVRMGGMALQMSFSGELLACMTHHERLSVMDTATGDVQYSFPNAGGEHCYRFTPDFAMVAMASQGGQVQVWTIDNVERPMWHCNPHADVTNITGVAVLPENNVVLSCAEDGHLFALSLIDGAILSVYAATGLQPIHCFDILPTRLPYPRLAIGDDNGRVVVLDWIQQNQPSTSGIA
ncbi:hypothetical protein DYB34_004388 [Aphanomyces astaci]|uniref:sphingomyelin phosphodiesterase n=1 Tax=Aphanomyces astaci TaxID=112090 RepID=A0A418BF53_APHAT|nr:hypothetical protein DYB34_004388 [Aphanomyces astaci]